jgi:methionyl-tRNA formyltransferase
MLRGETVAGNSIIRLAEKMDAGAILAQSQLTIGELETAGELHDRLAEDGAPLVLSTLAALAAGPAGTAIERPQDDTKATLAPKLSRSQTQLDFANIPAAELALKIRGLYPWPGCRIRLTDAVGGEKARATLVRVRVATGEGPRWHPGDITTRGTISVGDGAQSLEIIELQPEGRTPMSLASYKNGHPWMAGMHVESIV